MSGERRVHVGVIGTGLIGGSVAKRLATIDEYEVTVNDAGPDVRDGLRTAGFRTVDEVSGICAVADVIVVAVPLAVEPDVINEAARELKAIGRTGVVVTNVGSVMGRSSAYTAAVAGAGCVFVPGHPMAGTEKSGLAAAFEGLFDGSTWALSPGNSTLADFMTVCRMAVDLGARVSVLDADHHDRIVSVVSHVPYVLAASEMLLVPSDEDERLALRMSAGSFRDVTRVASSSPEFSANLVGHNHQEVAASVGRLRDILDRFHALLQAGDMPSIQEMFTEAHDRRQTYLEMKGSSASRVQEVGESESPAVLLASGARGAVISAVERHSGSWTVTLEGE